MNLKTFFESASPTTLASLIADIQAMGTGAESEQLALERRAMTELVANVGESEAKRLIEDAVNGGPNQ